MNLSLTQAELDIVKHILKGHDVLLFGSRTKGTARPFSDLDICVTSPLKPHERQLLLEAFEKSSLPFTVDLIAYEECDDTFQALIDREGVRLG